MNFNTQDAVASESDSSSGEEADPKAVKASAKPIKSVVDTTVPPSEANAVKKQLAAAKLVRIPLSYHNDLEWARPHVLDRSYRTYLRVLDGLQ